MVTVTDTKSFRVALEAIGFPVFKLQKIKTGWTIDLFGAHDYHHGANKAAAEEHAAYLNKRIASLGYDNVVAKVTWYERYVGQRMFNVKIYAITK